MADTKVSELPAATSVKGSDSLYVVQSGVSKQVSVSTLFANAANTTLRGNINLDGIQNLTTPGVIDLTKQITLLTADATGGLLSLTSGTANQLKIILLGATSGGTYTISSNIAGNSTITFSNIGDTAQLLFVDTKWYMIGGTAAIV